MTHMVRQTMALALMGSLVLCAPSLASEGRLGVQVTKDARGGVRIERVLQRSAAEAFGLKEGYRIMAVGDELVRSEEHFIQLAGRIRPGSWQTVDLVANGVRISGMLTTQDRKSAETSVPFQVPTRGVIGVAVDNSHPEVLGARVRQVDRGGAASLAGLRSGDVIVEVNGVRTETAHHVIVAIAARPELPTKLVVARGRHLLSVAVVPTAIDDTGRLTVPAAKPAETSKATHWCDQSGVQTAACVAGGMLALLAVVAAISDETGDKAKTADKGDQTKAAQRARESAIRRNFEALMDAEARREGRNPN